MVFAGEDEVLGSTGGHQLCPGGRVEEMGRELGAELLVLEVGREMLLHELQDLHVTGVVGVSPVPLVPEPLHTAQAFTTTIL